MNALRNLIGNGPITAETARAAIELKRKAKKSWAALGVPDYTVDSIVAAAANDVVARPAARGEISAAIIAARAAGKPYSDIVTHVNAMFTNANATVQSVSSILYANRKRNAAK